MGRDSDIFSLYPEKIQMAPGASAIFAPIPGQIACTIKYETGGTMAFIGTSASFGSSFAIANKYVFATTEIFNFDSAGQFSIEVQGATTTFYIIRSRSAGFVQS